MNDKSASKVRVGTWNLDGKWSSSHQALLAGAQCDIWLLTEISPKACSSQARMGDYHCHFSKGVMARNQHWAAILSLKNICALPDPHAASAAARIDGITYCSSILPWAGSGSNPSSPWIGTSLEAMTRAAVTPIAEMLPVAKAVWGGDWNQNLFGGWEYVGSRGMRVAIESAVDSLKLRVATDKLPHQISGSHTIDHIAVPSQWVISKAERISATGLSDHDAYVIDAHIKK